MRLRGLSSEIGRVSLISAMLHSKKEYLLGAFLRMNRVGSRNRITIPPR